ncbi:hypothetical protein E2C01_032231 [Portunus trituberculatus]|uniref:Uncharacterized protein n=1 Tax=Portunus trituberculatus TaxID=210409 RepID=A0A5B7F0C6_PORTR|nr:hypothetical protein [Portunus trituberculatus]
MFVMVRGRVCPRGRRPPALHRPSSVSKLFVFITLSGAVKLSKPTTSVCFRGFGYIHGYSEWLGAGESTRVRCRSPQAPHTSPAWRVEALQVEAHPELSLPYRCSSF